MKIKVSNVNTPNWKDVNVKSHIPVELEKLSELARNIWWSWNYEATELFKDLDPVLWKEVGQNPVLLLERMSYAKLEALAKDKVILRRMEDVYSKFRNYMDVKPDSNRPSVAYFSMEYGLNHVLKIYSGGLGVLAGDYLKEASDSNVDLCAVVSCTVTAISLKPWLWMGSRLPITKLRTSVSCLSTAYWMKTAIRLWWMFLIWIITYTLSFGE